MREEEREKFSKNNRILDLYVRLSEGKMISKVTEAQHFGVDERSIQRDIDDIRAFLSEKAPFGTGVPNEIVYDRKEKGFYMKGNEQNLMTNSEILAVTKILLESRAFPKKEMGLLVDKLIAGCVPLKNLKLVSELISNEKYHYVELKHNKDVMDMLWEIGSDVKEHELIEITYTRATDKKERVSRIVEPVAIMFSDFYFYLQAYIVEENEAGEYEHRFDYPAIFRIDRIKTVRMMERKFKIPYANRFEEGEFRKRIQFMTPGKLTKVEFKFYAPNAEAILDRLPTARIKNEKDGEFLIEAEIYGKGLKMWLLSQGEKVEVLKPTDFREEMILTLNEMIERYK